MNAPLLSVIFLVCAISPLHALTDTNCVSYDADQLKEEHCPQSMRDSDNGPFREMYNSMYNANHQEQRPDFVVHAIEWMFKFLHCASEMHAIASIFFHVPISMMPPVNSDWWRVAHQNLNPTESIAPSQYIGRRKRADPMSADDRLLLDNIREVAFHTDPSCVQWLIDHFADEATLLFKQQHPNFPDPNKYTLNVTTVPTVPKTSSSPQANTLTSNNQSDTVVCYNCQDLDCLIKDEADLLAQCSGSYCMINMVESRHYGREIFRSCGNQASCMMTKNNPAQCENLEHQLTDPETQCLFCCTGDGCNAPPHIIPDTGRLVIPAAGGR